MAPSMQFFDGHVHALFLLVLMMICCNLYASDMFPLKPDENPRGAIALTLREEVGLLNARFDIKRIEINETRELAYFAAC